MGLIRPVGGSDYIIIPRTALLETYSNWLKEQRISGFDLSTAKSEAAVQRSLLEAGIPFKHEGNNPATWRYPFYSKDKKLLEVVWSTAWPFPFLISRKMSKPPSEHSSDGATLTQPLRVLPKLLRTAARG